MTTRTLDMANVIASDVTIAGDKTLSGDITFSGDVVPSTPLSHRNLIINGAMQVAQRGTSAVTANAGYPVDRYRTDFSNDGSFSFQQVSESPANFQYSIKWTVTGTDTSFSASQYAYFRTILEGQDIAHLNWGSSDARTVTLSFYIKSSATGTFGGAVWNNAFNRSYPFTYTVSSANTWERKTITIPGDTSGTWETGNGRGINIAPLGFAGSNYIAAAGSWDAGGRVTATGATNFMTTNSATYHFTGVQLEIGDNATPFEYRSYADELQRCQRYYLRMEQNPTVLYGHYSAAPVGTYVSRFDLPTTMRATPTTTHGTTVGTMNFTRHNVDGLTWFWSAVNASNYAYVANGITVDAEL